MVLRGIYRENSDEKMNPQCLFQVPKLKTKSLQFTHKIWQEGFVDRRYFLTIH